VIRGPCGCMLRDGMGRWIDRWGGTLRTTGQIPPAGDEGESKNGESEGR